MSPERTGTRAASAASAAPAALLLGMLALGVAGAQTAPAGSQPASPARDMPRPSELEPAVDTTRAPPPAPASGTQAPAPQGAAGADSRQETPAAKRGKGPDRLQLDTTEITGNRELPKVLYIVPWKRSDLGDLTGRPVNSLLDEVLQPLDRDVFTRENRYYDALKPDRAAPKADLSAGSGDKP
jgi:hypothetical protein